MNADSNFSWLHISDFHFSAKKEYEINLILEAFLKSLPDLIERFGKPHAIFATGDIAFSGIKIEYEKATIFFDELINNLDIPRERLFVIPGNHDIDRNAEASGLSRTLDSQRAADDYFGRGKELIHIRERMKAFGEWYDNYFSGIRSFPVHTTGFDLEIFNVGNRKIEVLLLNSATFCFDDSDHEKLWMGRSCITKACNQFQKNNDTFRLALMHHPFEWLATEEQSNIKALIHDHTDCVLSGHLHENSVTACTGTTGNSIHLAAGAMYQTRIWQNTAMFCSLQENNLIVSPIRYEDKPREVWAADTSIFPKEKNYQKYFLLPRFINNGVRKNIHRTEKQAFEVTNPSIIGKISSEKMEFEKELFVTPSGIQIYVEPRLMKIPQNFSINEDGIDGIISIKEIVASDKSFVIESRTEYGTSTIAKRLNYEFSEVNKFSIIRDASELPNYRKKLEVAFTTDIRFQRRHTVLILDNFDPERDERLLKEINDLGYFQRVILLYVNRGLKPSSTTPIIGDSDQFRFLYLWTLSRTDIRSMAMKLFDSTDQVYLSAIVDKVYKDLLGLCIPLTPSNVIMYLRVLFREGEFQPLNRVDILSRYISDILKKPSDAYSNSFNAKNKIDVVSEFAYYLFEKGAVSFQDLDWYNFIKEFQFNTLLEFDAKSLLEDLETGKIFIRSCGYIYFKYSFYFSFFLGRYVANRPNILSKFIESEGHLKIRGIVDVITSLNVENTELLLKLSENLHSLLNEFSRRYLPIDFDPLAGAIWPETNQEDKLWRSVTVEIDAAPKSAREIDTIKTSISAEIRTSDQEIRYTAYREMEIKLFAVACILTDALKNSEAVSGDIKLRAQDAIFKCHFIGYQLGCILANELAKSPLVQWGGVAFIDFNQIQKSANSQKLNEAELITKVIIRLALAVVHQCKDDIGVHKLGPIFHERKNQDSDINLFRAMNFACILNAKSTRWAEFLEEIIKETDKNSYYLNMFLNILRHHLKEEIIQIKDREILKKLIALIQTKRTLKKQSPGAKAINKMLNHLKKIDAFKESPKTGKEFKKF